MENILKWELTIGIRRRFIQMCNFYENEEYFAYQIMTAYDQIAEELLSHLGSGPRFKDQYDNQEK